MTDACSVRSRRFTQVLNAGRDDAENWPVYRDRNRLSKLHEEADSSSNIEICAFRPQRMGHSVMVPFYRGRSLRGFPQEYKLMAESSPP